jgi:hypothetical protein
VTCLKHIFAKYCVPAPNTKVSGTLQHEIKTPPKNAVLDVAGLDAWATATNGKPLSDEEKGDLELLDVDDNGYLT